MRLIDGAADAVRRLNAAGVPVVVVTNQSGIGRGLLTEADYQAVHARFAGLLEATGARLDATYHCPHWPERDGPCGCRKPELGMYVRAAREHGFDLARSAYIGDRWRDVAPAVATGGHGALVPSHATPSADRDLAHERAALVPTLADALDLLLPRLVAP